MKDLPVKIDRELKKRIEELISKGETRFEFPSVKNFVDKAVLKLLKEIESREEAKEGKKEAVKKEKSEEKEKKGEGKKGNEE